MENKDIYIGSYDAKTHLPALLKRTEQGEHFVITRHGMPIARLSPLETPYSSADTTHIIEQFRKLRSQHSLGGLSIREMIEEGRRY